MSHDDPRSFAAFLANVNDGAVADELADRLVELTAAMQRQVETSGGKPKGKITLSIDLTLDRGIVDVSADVSVKMPKTVRGRSIMYILPNGGVSAKNPRQTELELEARDVSTVAPVRAIGATR